MPLKKFWICLALTAVFCQASAAPRDPIAGTLHLEGGKKQEFTDVISLIFSLSDGEESIPQNVSEWPFIYDSASIARAVPLIWMRSLEVVRHETKSGYRCLFKPTVSIETVSGVVLESELKTLEWIRVRTAEGQDRTFYFASGDKIQIRKITFKSR